MALCTGSSRARNDHSPADAALLDGSGLNTKRGTDARTRCPVVRDHSRCAGITVLVSLNRAIVCKPDPVYA